MNTRKVLQTKRNENEKYAPEMPENDAIKQMMLR